MDAFEFAMQMELDGKAMYEEHAAKADIPGLKTILLDLAADEQKHYNIFKAMKEGRSVEYEEAKATKIVDSVRNVFQTLKAQNKDFSFSDDVRTVWDKARDIEKKSEAFYRRKGNEAGDEKQKHIFNRIADEEHKHWQMIEHVIQFLDQPRSYLDDAEWNNLDSL
ncbi:MAG TPA: ferritin family protein [candidate division Zixibacteria bacterium]|nr:ferritin family protein [candidate division Zixibacteria bacterium]